MVFHSRQARFLAVVVIDVHYDSFLLGKRAFRIKKSLCLGGGEGETIP
jgi:hypothetical protein